MPSQGEDAMIEAEEDRPSKGLPPMELNYSSNGHHQVEDLSSEGEAAWSPGSAGNVVCDDGGDEKEARVARLAGENEELSGEIAALKLENEAVARSVKKLEDQVRDDAVRLDLLAREADETKKEVVEEIAAARRQVSALELEKAALGQEKLAIASEKERVEVALAVAASNVSELSKKVDDAESAAAVAKEKVALLDAEVRKLAGDCEILQDSNAELLALNARLDVDLKAVAASREALVEEREKLLLEIKGLEAEASSAKEVAEAMRAQDQAFKTSLLALEEKLAAASRREAELEAQNHALASSIRQLEAQVCELKKCSSEHESLAAELQRERELRAALQEQVLGLNTRKQSLEEEVKQALSTIQKMQDITQREQGQRRMLEDQVSSMMREKGRVEEAKTGVEAELRQLSSSSAKAEVTAKAEVLSLKQKIEGLECSLGRVKEEALSSEKKVWQLRSELSKARDMLECRSSFARFALPAALVSTGALVAAGVVGYLRLRQQ